MISRRALRIRPSVTLSISARAKQMKADGIDVVGFGAGEPDFDTPENVKEAGVNAIKAGFTKYTASGGTKELKEAVCAKFKRENGIAYSPKEVLVSCGGKHTLLNAMLALLNPGDEAILPSPYWISYEEQIRLAEAVPVIAPTDKFHLKADLIASRITGKTRLIIVNSPSNPTGAVCSGKELKKIADLALERNLFVISDEVYEHFIYDGNRHASIASLNEEIKRQTLTVNAVSKTYSMTGWRIGFCGGPEPVINAMDNLQSHMTSNPTSISQAAAVEALNGPQESVRKMLKAFEERRRVMVDGLNRANGISCPLPEGAFYAFPDISGTGTGSMEFSERLLEKAKVAVIPGKDFGADGHVRLSYACSMENVKKGVERLQDFCEKL